MSWRSCWILIHGSNFEKAEMSGGSKGTYCVYSLFLPRVFSALFSTLSCPRRRICTSCIYAIFAPGFWLVEARDLVADRMVEKPELDGLLLHRAAFSVSGHLSISFSFWLEVVLESY